MKATTPSRSFSCGMPAVPLLLVILLLLELCCNSNSTTDVLGAEPTTTSFAGEEGGELDVPFSSYSTAASTSDEGKPLPVSSSAFGQVEIFLDPVCPKSAQAWPTLQRIVRQHRRHVDFVFYILPLSDWYPIGYFAAKAVQVILAYSGTDGGYDDVEPFLDLMFKRQHVLLSVGDEPTADRVYDAQEIVSDWAFLSSGLPEGHFHSAMQDPDIDQAILDDLEKHAMLSMPETPAALLKHVFAMNLGGEKELMDFEVFVSNPGGFSNKPSGRSPSRPSYDDPDDTDDSLLLLPRWVEVERDMKVDYEDNRRQQGLLQQQQLQLRQQHNIPKGAAAAEAAAAAIAAKEDAAIGAAAAVEQLRVQHGSEGAHLRHGSRESPSSDAVLTM